MPGNLSPLFTWRSAIAKSDLPPTVRLVAFALSLYMNELGGSAWPSIPTLASDSGLSVASVKRGTRALEKAGYLACKRETGLPTHYSATVPTQLSFEAEEVTQNRAQSEPGSQGDGTGLTVIRDPAQGEPLSSQEHVNTTPVRKTRASRFTEFWKAYPRKDDKGKAKPAFDRAAKKAPADEIIAGAIRYRDDPNRDPEFTKLPTTWLNAGAWENGPLPERNGHRPSGHPTDRRVRELLARNA